MRAHRPPRVFWFGHLTRATVGAAVAAAFRTTVTGAENLPTQGGVVLAGNHVSNMDPVLLWCRSPRPAHFMAKAELWEHGWLGWLLDRFWAFPVRRGAADREAIAIATRVLKEGEPLGIFPEGTRNRDGEAEPHDGAAFLALRAGVPVVPVGIAGTDLIKPPGARWPRFPRVVIRFGEPIHPDSFTQSGKKERVEAMTAEIMRRIGLELEAAKGARS